MKVRKPATAAERHAAEVGGFRAAHLSVAERVVETEFGHAHVLIDEAESPLAWLARRKSRSGEPLIAAHQLMAGERLRGDFTRANMMPRTTSNWASPVARARGAAGHNRTAALTDTMIASKARLRQALDAVGPEFSGLLLDVCCFLKGLENVESERGWPARSAKVVLQLALDRLSRHYGFSAQARGPARTPVRTWLAPGEQFTAEF